MAPRLLTGLLVGLVIGVSAGCSAAPTPTPAPTTKPAAAAKALPAGEATRGKQLYTQSCAGCHGQDAKGLPGLGKDMTTSAFVKNQSDAELVAFIKKGRPVTDPANTTKVDMPPKGGNPTLTDPQLADVVAYIRSLQR